MGEEEVAVEMGEEEAEMVEEEGVKLNSTRWKYSLADRRMEDGGWRIYPSASYCLFHLFYAATHLP